MKRYLKYVKTSLYEVKDTHTYEGNNKSIGIQKQKKFRNKESKKEEFTIEVFRLHKMS